MAAEADALDDLLASPAPMGDDEPDELDDVDPDDEDDEFSMHATDALGGDATPEQVESLRLAILALTRGT